MTTTDDGPAYKRCGQCNRCTAGVTIPPIPGDCWADYLHQVAATLKAGARAAGPGER